MAWCYVKKKKTMFSVHFYVLIGRFLGVKTLEKNPTGQQVTGLSSLARTECIPVAPLTQWHVVLLLEVGLCGFCQLPYKSVHTSLPPDWNPDKWFNLRRTGLAFSSPPPPDHIPGRYEAPGFLHALGRKMGKRKKTMLGNAPASSTDCLTASCEIQPIIRQQQRVRPST